MRQMSMTIQGLYNYDPTIFDSLSVPDGMDKQLTIDNIILRNACYTLLYPSADYMRKAIATWARTELDIWEKLYATEKYEYNPIYNYSRYETSEDSSTTSSDQDASSLTQVTGYNSSRMADRDRQAQQYKTANTGTIKHNAHMYGNIGVTTTQKMIADEREISNFCTYDVIADSFRDNFCVRVF